ncbi:MAG: four helix bundle protein [Cyclobacteriaceae bacterium]|nr:four helix bundle protein [Cyclobacteriaceae bacterium]
MGKIDRFEDLDVWQKSRHLSQIVYSKTNEGSFATDYSLKDQINRSTGSIMDNIAEGFEREGRKEFIQFLSFSKSSAGEVRSQLYRAKDRGHITNQEFESLLSQVETIGKMLGGFMNYLKKSEIKGLKYKVEEAVVEYHNLKSEI